MDESERPSDPDSISSSSTGSDSNADDRRILELELAKVRKEAAAARLEARAAELELMIRRLSQQAPEQVASLLDEISTGTVSVEGIEEVLTSLPDAESTSSETRRAAEAEYRIDPAQPKPAPAPAQKQPAAMSRRPVVFVNGGTSGGSTRTENPTSRSTTSHSGRNNKKRSDDSDFPSGKSKSKKERPAGSRITSWDDVRRTPVAFVAGNEAATALVDEAPSAPITKEERVTRFDAGRRGPSRPHFAPLIETKDNSSREDEESKTDDASVGTALLDIESEEHREPFAETVELDDVELEPTESEPVESRRRRPAAILISTVAHIAILLLLALFTLSTHRPKDQVALSASVSDPSEEQMETFEFETVEPTEAPSEPTETAAELEISPVGTIAVTKVSPDAAPGPPAPNLSDMLSQSQLSASSMSLSSTSESKIQFCGVEGGGNHFVYLVDSSGSMGTAFESARAELLHSIDALKPNQRFYVVFFDAESDYMRLSDPNTDESGSVKATDANKQALRRWAVGIKMDRGRAPYDPLRFALKLKPDVIFLLSDGEFPQGIEDLLAEENHFDNLFGDEGLISIVHTIGYHSREGESRMKRIAQQNKGQYRHVPKP